MIWSKSRVHLILKWFRNLGSYTVEDWTGLQDWTVLQAQAKPDARTSSSGKFWSSSFQCFQPIIKILLEAGDPPRARRSSAKSINKFLIFEIYSKLIEPAQMIWGNNVWTTVSQSSRGVRDSHRTRCKVLAVLFQQILKVKQNINLSRSYDPVNRTANTRNLIFILQYPMISLDLDNLTNFHILSRCINILTNFQTG